MNSDGNKHDEAGDVAESLSRGDVKLRGLSHAL